VPPRYAYWTILIDQKPTAFRARDKEELLPTLGQLRRKNTDVVMKWFARGRIWDSPEQAEWAQKHLTGATQPKRDSDWRPGGKHQDPRDRFRPRSKQGGLARREPPKSKSTTHESTKHESTKREYPPRESPPRPERLPAAKSATAPAWKRPRPTRAGQRPGPRDSRGPASAGGRRPQRRPDRKRRS
jgi:hypothetical protein